MFFSRAHAIAIVEGRKTVLYRATMPRNRKIGNEYAVQIRPRRKGVRPDPPLGKIKLTSIRTVHLRDITDEDAVKAGYADAARFKQRWIDAGNVWDEKRVIYRVEWELRSVVDREQEAAEAWLTA